MFPVVALAPFFAIGGWWAWRYGAGNLWKGTQKWPKAYLEGLNYLLTDHPDKAIELLVKTLDIDRRTVETHLALGNLFRRRGEFDRAIRLHQRLVSYPSLSTSERDRATLALAEDYLKSGIFEQAENLFLKVKERASSQELQIKAIHSLIEIYERERDWNSAIEISKIYTRLTGKARDLELSHYYCELAEQSFDRKDTDGAYRFLLDALSVHSKSIRVYIMLGDFYRFKGDYAKAIAYYQDGIVCDPGFIGEALVSLEECYRREHDESAYLRFLLKYQREYPRVSLVYMISQLLQQGEGIEAAISFLQEHLQDYPSLRGVLYLLELRFFQVSESERRDVLTLQSLITQLLMQRPRYRCETCGFSGKNLHWHCPTCHSWSTIRPIMGIEGEG